MPAPSQWQAPARLQQVPPTTLFKPSCLTATKAIGLDAHGTKQKSRPGPQLAPIRDRQPKSDIGTPIETLEAPATRSRGIHKRFVQDASCFAACSNVLDVILEGHRKRDRVGRKVRAQRGSSLVPGEGLEPTRPCGQQIFVPTTAFAATDSRRCLGSGALLCLGPMAFRHPMSALYACSEELGSVLAR